MAVAEWLSGFVLRKVLPRAECKVSLVALTVIWTQRWRTRCVLITHGSFGLRGGNLVQVLGLQLVRFAPLSAYFLAVIVSVFVHQIIFNHEGGEFMKDPKKMTNQNKCQEIIDSNAKYTTELALAIMATPSAEIRFEGRCIFAGGHLFDVEDDYDREVLSKLMASPEFGFAVSNIELVAKELRAMQAEWESVAVDLKVVA